MTTLPTVHLADSLRISFLCLTVGSTSSTRTHDVSSYSQWLPWTRLPRPFSLSTAGQRCEDYITHNASSGTPTRPRSRARRRLSLWSLLTVPLLRSKGFGPRFWPAEPSTCAVPLPSQPAAPGLPRTPPRVSALPVSAGAGAGSQLELLSAALARRSLVCARPRSPLFLQLRGRDGRAAQPGIPDPHKTLELERPW